MISFSKLGKQGRLGNQLFQMAATISHAINQNTSYVFPKWQYENYFNLTGCFSNNIKIEKTYTEPYFHYSDIPRFNNLELSGYFQSELYFLQHKDIIKQLLTPKYEVQLEPGLCGIHVRRGDYLNLTNCYTQLDMNYYNQAMQESGCSKFLVFSDDIEWCKCNFKGEHFEFSERHSDYEDLAIMVKKCQSLIIANSSFSWWGSYLNSNDNKKVIAPSKWFGPQLQHNIKDLMPSSEAWITI